MNNKLFSIQEAANILGVSTKTLRRWDQRGRFVPTRTAGNQRRYTQEQISKLKTSSFAKASEGQAKLKNVSEAEPLFSLTEISKKPQATHSLPQILSGLPSGSFLKNHFLLKHKDEIESNKPQGSLGEPFEPASFTRPPLAKLNPFKIGFVFASLVLLLSLGGAFALTKYNVVAGLPGLVAGLTEKKEQFAKFIANLPQISLQIKNRDLNGDLSFVPQQDLVGSVLAAATGDSSLILNVNVPSFFSEPVTIGTTTPEPSAILNVVSEDQGFLAPRMTQVQIEAIPAPAAGLFVYNTTTNHYNMYNGTSWQGVFTSIGDSTTGEAFTETGTSGTALYFYDADGRGKLTIANLSGVRTYTLPDASGEVSLLGQSISNSELVNAKVTVTAGTNLTGGGEVALGSSVTLTLKDSIALAGTLTVSGVTTLTGATAIAGALTANGNVTLGDAITDTITFTGRVAQDSSLIPIGTTGTNDLGSSSLPWDNLYANNAIAGGTSGIFGWLQRNNNAVSPTNITDDLLIGGISTSSAKIALINIAGGTPTATISANSGNNATTLTGLGVLGTTNMQTLTLGNSSTGNVVIDSGSSAITLSDDTTISGDLAVNGGTSADVTSTTTTGTLFNAAVTTLSLGGAATTLTMGATTGTASIRNATVNFPNATGVGIGNTAPLTALDVTGSASLSANFSLRGSGTAHTFNILDNGTLNFQRSPGGDAGVLTALFIQNNGNVGIGNTAPGAMLSVGSSTALTISSAGLLTVANTTDTTSGITGSINTLGGVGITKSLWVGGSANSAQIFAALGTALLPGYSFQSSGTSDPDTGIWSPAANTVAFSTGGTEALRITSGQKVGIGNTTPLTELDVTGSASLSANISLRGSGTAHTFNILDNGSLNFRKSIGGDAGVTNVLYLENSGNVGIGNIAPTALLAVGSTSQFTVSSAGAIVSVGVNSGSGLIQGTGGITVTGTGNINATGTSATNIGNSTGALVIASGGTSSWTNTSGNLTIQTATSGTMAVDSAGALNIGPTNATSLGIGRSGVTTTVNGTLATTSPDITTSLTTPSTTFSLVNTTATTVNLAGAATTFTLGATTGTASIRNATVNFPNATLIGIGNTAPLTALDVTGSASLSANLSLRGSGTAHTFNILDNGTLNFQRSPGGDAGVTNVMFLGNNGNVGIGTTAPGAKLEVTGNILLTKEAARTITVDPSTTADTAGGALTINAGTGSGTGAGGLLTLAGGTNSATGNGGGVTILSRGSSGSGTVPGDIALTAGNASGSTNASGGAITLTGGAAANNGFGGAVTIIGGLGGASGVGAPEGGDVEILGGAAQGSDNPGGDIFITGGAKTGSGAAGDVLLGITSGGTARGNVGIGTTAPAGLFHVSSDTAATGLSFFTQANASADGFDQNFRKARGTGAAPTVITTADELGVINFTGYGGAAGYITGAAIKGISSGTIADSRVPGQLSFWTGTNAAPSVLTERMTILNSGNVGIGTTAPGSALSIVGSIGFNVDSFISFLGVATATNGNNYALSGNATDAAPYTILNVPTSGYLDFRVNNVQLWRYDASANFILGAVTGFTTPGAGATYNLVLGGGATSPVIGAAAADRVHLAAVDFAAGDRRLAIQSELGSVINIGNDTVRATWATQAAADATVDLCIVSGTTYSLCRITSSLKYKEPLGEWTLDTKSIYNIKLEDWVVKRSTDGKRHYSPIAEYSYAANPAFAELDEQGQPIGINWYQLNTAVLAEVQKHELRLSSIEKGLAIDSAGNIGIGTAAPLTALDVTGSASLSANVSLRGSGTAHTFNILDNGSLNIQKSIGGDAGLATVLYLQNSGNVGIGLTAPTVQLELSTSGAQKSTGTTWSNPSDIRLKTNISSFTDGLSVIKQINPVHYTLNGLANTPAGTSDIGVIAQDILPIAPYTISTYDAKLNPNDATTTQLYRFNASALTFALINAVKNIAQVIDLTSAPTSTPSMVIDSNGKLGIGTTAPSFKLDLADMQIATAAAQIFNIATGTDADGLIIKLGNTSTTEVASTNHFLNFETAGIGIVGSISGNGGTGVTYATSGIADFAEYFKKDPNQNVEFGSVMCINESGFAVLCNSLNSKILGIASEKPAFLGGENLGDNSIAVGLVGQVYTLVSTANGEIKPGDALTSSDIPGVTMKATKPGQIVGKALEAFGGSSLVSSQLVGENDELPTNQLTNNQVGKILVSVNVGWYDPAIYIASDGTLGGVAPTVTPTDTDLALKGEALQPQVASSSASINYVLENDPLFKDLKDKVSSLQSKLDLLSLQFDQQASISGLLASQGETLQAQIASSSAALNLGNVEIYNATITDNLMVLGRTTVTDLGVTGSINAGILAIHGLDGEINTLSGDLYLQKAGLGGVDILNGKIVMDTKGNLTVAGTITAQEISANNYTVLGQQSIGSATIPTGATSIEVTTQVASQSSKIFLTTTSLTTSQITVVEKSDGRFKVAIPQPTTSPISFDWWIVGNK